MRTLALLLALFPIALYSEMFPEVVLAHGWSPAVAASHSRLLVVCRTATELDGVFADFKGNPLGGPFPIASISGPTHHSIASDGMDFLVGWMQNGEVRAAIVRAEGGTVEPLPPIASTASIDDPSGERIAVAFDGTRYLLFWHDAAVAHAAVITTGGVIRTTLTLYGLTAVGGAIAVPTRTVVVGTGPGKFPSDTIGISATVIGASLFVSDPVFLAGEPFTFGSGSPYAKSPAIAADADGNLFAVWIRGRTSRTDEIETTRLASNLQPLDVRPSTQGAIYGTVGRVLNDNATSWADRHDGTRIAAAGRDFVVAWALDSAGPDLGVWAAFVDAAGVPSLILPLSTRGRYSTSFYANSPDMVGFPDGHAVVVYARDPQRIVARSINSAPPPRRRVTR